MTPAKLLKLLPEHLESLIKGKLYLRVDLPADWKDKTGIYIFYENEKPIYVGRGRNLRNRIMQHSRPSVQDSPLAYKLTAEELNHTTSYVAGKGRASLKKHKKFASTFKNMKLRVSEMKVRAIVLNDDEKGILSHTFEAYVVCALKTKYNSFLTT